MNLDWLKDVRGNKEHERQRIAEIQAARPALKVLKNILERKIEEAQRVAKTKDLYESPAWAYYQADNNGVVRAYTEILTLLDLGDK